MRVLVTGRGKPGPFAVRTLGAASKPATAARSAMRDAR
jgi:hypothetical protein